MSGENGVVTRKRSDGGVEGDAAWTGAAFEKSCHVHAPVVGGLRPFGSGELNPREFLGFRERVGRNFRTDGGPFS